MVSFEKLLLLFQVLIKLTLLRESNSVNSLQVIIVFVSQPVSRRILCNFDSLNPISWRKMWTRAQINEITTSIGRSKSVLRDFIFYQLNFEWIVGEHLKCLCFCKQNPLVWLLLLSVFLYFLLYFLIVLLRYFCLPDKRIIEKSVVKRWTMAEPSSVKIFQALSKQMSTRMPKNLLPDFVLKRN